MKRAEFTTNGDLEAKYYDHADNILVSISSLNKTRRETIFSFWNELEKMDINTSGLPIYVYEIKGKTKELFSLEYKD